MAAGTSAIITTIIIDLVVYFVTILVFSFLRISRWSRKFIQPRSHDPRNVNKPHELPGSFFGWVLPIIMYKEPDIIDASGLDSAIFLRLASFGLELFFYLSIWCLISMLPINLTDDNIDILESGPQAENFKFTNFDKLSLANVQTSSPRMWMHMCSVYVVTLITLWLLWKYCKEFTLLRLMFQGNAPRGRSPNSILLTDIPAVASDTKSKSKQIQKDRKESVKRLKASSELALTNRTSNADLRAQASQLKGEKSEVAKGSPSDVIIEEKALEGEQQQLEGEVAAAAAAAEAKLQGEASQASLKAEGAARTRTPGAGPVAEAVEDKRAEAAEEAAEEAAAAEDLKPDGPAPPSGARRRFTYNLKDAGELQALIPSQTAKKVIKGGATATEMVKQELDALYPNEIQELHMVKNQEFLTPLYEEYEKLKLGLEEFIDMYDNMFKTGKEGKIKERGKMVVLMPMLGWWGKMQYGGGCGFLGCCGLLRKVDSFDHYEARLTFLTEHILEEQRLSSQVVWPTAFVTFKSRRAQAAAVTDLLSHDTAYWRTQPAPEPEDLIWKNLGWTMKAKAPAQFIAWCVFWLMCCFFMIPVAAVQALIEAAVSCSSDNGLCTFLNNPVVKSLIEGIVPGLALIIFMSIVPLLIRIMLISSGTNAESAVDLGVVQRYYIFQVIIVFFGSIVTGSFFNQVETWIKDPSSAIQILGTAIPMVCTFFCTYILTLCLLTQSIAFIRLVPLLIFWVLKHFNGSPKAIVRSTFDQFSNYGQWVAPHVLTLMLGLVYSCINPIICLFSLTYFAVNTLSQRYNELYVFRYRYESAGNLWTIMFGQIMFAIYLMQLVMIALLGIKKFQYTPLLIPVIFITMVFHFTVRNLFSKPWRVMALHNATEVDRFERELAKKDEEAGLPPPEPIHEAYLSPAFKVKAEDVNELLAEARAMAARVDAAVLANGGKKHEKQQPANPDMRDPEDGRVQPVGSSVGA